MMKVAVEPEVVKRGEMSRHRRCLPGRPHLLIVQAGILLPVVLVAAAQPPEQIRQLAGVERFPVLDPAHHAEDSAVLIEEVVDASNELP